MGSTRNCFCAHGSLFNCQKLCKGTVSTQQRLINWFKEQCLVDESEVENDIGVEGTKNITASLCREPHRLHWYEILPISIAALSGLCGIGITIMGRLM
jgi:hypothetical protein